MARIRTIKPEIWLSPQVMNLSVHARLLFIGLITQADDAGRGSADVRRLKAAVFGGDDCTSTDVRRWLDECAAQGLARLYDTATHGNLYALPSWRSHQSIDRPKDSAYPGPDSEQASPMDRRTIVEHAPKDREGSEGSEGSEGRNLTRIGAEASAKPDAPKPPAMVDQAWVEQWQAIRKAYPAGAGRQDWIGAERLARRLVDDGMATTAELLEGVARYAALCAATGRMVLNPARFFGDADRPWSQAWPIPLPKAGTNGANPLALAAWDALIATEGASRQTDPRAAHACGAIGGWLAVKGRTDRNARQLREDFCRAWSAAEVAPA